MQTTKLFLRVLMLFSILLYGLDTFGQGNETFVNFSETTSSYVDGTFLGQDGSTWTYVKCRGDVGINGSAIMLGRSQTPQSNFYSGTITGGVGTISFNYMQAYSTNVNLNILINDVVVGNVTSAGEQNVVKNSGDIIVNVTGDFVIKFSNANNADGQVVVDDVIWTAYTAGGNTPPSISNIVQTPAEDITSTTTVSVSADITDSDGSVQAAELRWGISFDQLNNTINMPLSAGSTYTTTTDIPAQTNGTIVYYQIYAEDNEAASSLSPVQNYEVKDPATATIPYIETFDADLGDCYTYSVSGDTKTWNHNGAGTAQMNGYNSGDIETDWLILPGITLNNDGVTLTFDSWFRYGIDDANNYLKLYYSTDYFGIGNPESATWTEIAFTQASVEQIWETSGIIDLSSLVGNPVWFGFKYNYEPGSYRWWQIDNINILGNHPPVIANIVTNPASGILSTSTVSVSADVTDNDGTVQLVELRWGTAADALNNTINMPLSAGSTYTTTTDIPAQANETTVYYRVYAEDNEATSTLSDLNSYLVKNPVTTTIPYYEPFDLDLGDCYVHSVSGDTKTWYHNATNGTAQVNGYNSGDIETDWLILPGVTLNNDNYIISFISMYDFGIDDVNNYLKLYYSTNYAGVGNPENATWTEIPFNQPSIAQQWEASGNIDLSAIVGDPVWFGFKYNYNPGSYRSWQIDNIEIKSPPAPGDAIITVSDLSLFNFDEVYVNNLSDVQFYYVSGTDLTADITITAPNGFLVSLDCNNSFGSSVNITPIGGTVNDTRVYVRFQPNSQSTFNGTITNESTGSNIETVSVSGTGIANQIPAGYYNTATGTEGVLMDQLHQIIKNHTSVSYTSLWNHFANTDEKFNGKVWDIYSDLRCEESPYEYIFFDNQDSGTGGGQEGDAYNREHSWPSSWWGGSSDTMYTDIYHLYPADKHVNGQRGSYIFGQTNSPSWTSLAGHKLGNNSYGGVYTGTIFEPSDEYKGDFARTYFYMVTRYLSRLAEWSTYANVEHILDGSQYPAFEPWALDMLLEWHNNDPVSQKEINRNNAIYAIQGNRNPFIDNPQFVNEIWGTPAEPTPVASIAVLRQQSVDGITVYHLTGEALLTFQQTYRNKKYIQDPDGQAAIEIDDPNNIITTAYSRYDGITGIKGTLTSYNNLLQFVPVEDPGAPTSTANIIVPEEKTLIELNSNDQAKLLKIRNVSFGITGTFANGTNYPISDPSAALVFSTNFYNTDYINTAIPETNKHITAIIYQNLDVIQITARELNDFEDVALLGDVNGDGFINVLDVVWMVSYINGNPPIGFITEAADINNDTLINVTDLTMLIDMILAGS